MGILLRIWSSFATKFCCAYFVLRMTIPVLLRIVLSLLFLLVRSLDVCVTIPVFLRIVLSLLFLLARSLDLSMVLFQVILCLLFLFARSLYLCMTILVLFRIIICISVSCSSKDYFGYLFLSISIELFLIMLVEHLRTPRIWLILYPNRCSYQKKVIANSHYCTQSMISQIKHKCV